MARNLELLLNTYVEEGAELLTIGDDQRKELQVSIRQEDVEDMARYLVKPVECRVRSHPTFEGQLARITHRAVNKPLHPALCAPNGGPLAVTTHKDSDTDADKMELAEPYFTGIIELPAELSTDLRAGTFGNASIRPMSESIGPAVYRITSKWLHEKLVDAQTRVR